MDKLVLQNGKKEAYKYLTAALPLQNKKPNKFKSVYEFIQEEPGEINTTVTDDQALFKAKDSTYISSKKTIHVIGDKLSDLFRIPLYKSNGGLDVTDNKKFGSVQTNENFKVQFQKTVNQTPKDTLQFESRFESGNLAIASYSNCNPRVYILALQRDINSRGITTQWFYFKVKNKKNLGTFTFNIVNYIKPFSMFKSGMKPCVYSVQKQKGWQRSGFNIEYRKNSISYEEGLNYYTLSFSYQFEYIEDQVYFAYCYPYTYSRLQLFLDSVERKHTDKMRRKTLTRTLGDNVVDMISITNPQYLNKRVIFITARAHPGETVGSFTCQAIINFLLSSHPLAQKLRNQFIVKIIPMLNPDGVINGNYRNSLSGDDLNRQWKNPSKNDHPEIFAAKKMILESQYKKMFFMDIHAHSKKKASFMYGCVSQKNPYIAKQLPYILSRKSSHFNYFTCNFTTPKSKQGTSRIVMWRYGGIDYSYTFEISFCGPQKEKRHFNIRDYQDIGIQMCKNISNYFYSRILDLQINEQINKHCEQFYGDEELLNIGNQDTNGSSSQLQEEVVKLYDGSTKIDLTKKATNLETGRSDGNKMAKMFQGFFYKNHLSQNSKKTGISREEEMSTNRELLRDRKKNLIQKQSYTRQRQSFMATRVNIQQIQLYENTHSSMSTSFYGLASEISSSFIENPRNSFYKNSQAALIRENSRKSEKTQSESFGILLPNVVKNQYKRYERIKRDKTNIGEGSNSSYVQHIMKNSVINSSTDLPRKQNKLTQEFPLVESIRSRTNDKR